MTEVTESIGPALIIAVAIASVGTALILSRPSPTQASTRPERPGCQFCGDSVMTTLGRSACTVCCVREKQHLELQMRETRLRIRLLEQQLKNDGSTSDQ